MASRYNNPTIDQLLDDPMTLALMRADRVDPAALKEMLYRMAVRLRQAEGFSAGHTPLASVPSVSGNPAAARSGAALIGCGMS